MKIMRSLELLGWSFFVILGISIIVHSLLTGGWYYLALGLGATVYYAVKLIQAFRQR